MEDYFIGEVRLFPIAFGYWGWIKCDGSSLSCSAYPQLYQAIGTRFGSDSPDTFKVPDLKCAQAFDNNMCYYMCTQGIIPTEYTMNFLIGSILLLPYDVNYTYYVECVGQSYPIVSNTALYSLIGIKFGGDGTTFKLPDLRKFAPITGLKYYMAIGGLYPIFNY